MKRVTLASWIEGVKDRIEHDYDEMIAVCGYTGNGKSSLAYLLARILDPTFTHARMCLSSDDLHTVLQDIQPGQVVVHDEGIEGLYSRDSMTRENKDIIRWLDVCRARRAILIVCMAHIRWLDDRVRGDRARWGFEVPVRGRAVLRRAYRPGPFSDTTETTWRPVLRFRFPAPGGPDWDAYQAAKKHRVESYDPRERRRSKRRKRQEDE